MNENVYRGLVFLAVLTVALPIVGNTVDMFWQLPFVLVPFFGAVYYAFLAMNIVQIGTANRTGPLGVEPSCPGFGTLAVSPAHEAKKSDQLSAVSTSLYGLMLTADG